MIGGWMTRFIMGTDRGQSTLLPECLDDWIDESNPLRITDARMGATHFLMKTLPKVASEMALSVLAYNLTRVMNIIGVKPLMAAITA
jgi:hypothetical protein